MAAFKLAKRSTSQPRAVLKISLSLGVDVSVDMGLRALHCHNKRWESLEGVQTPWSSKRCRSYGPMVLIDHINRIAPPAITRTLVFDQLSKTQSFSGIEHLQCTVCMQIVFQPVELHCRALVCTPCMIGWLTVSASCLVEKVGSESSPTFARHS